MSEKDRIIKDIKRIKSAIRIAEKTIACAPDGRGYVKNNGGRHSWYNYRKNDPGEGRIVRYVRKNSPEYKKLLNAEYCRRLLPVLEKEVRALERFSEEYDPDRKYRVLAEFPEPVRSAIDPILRDRKTEMREWANDDFASNSFPFDDGAVFLNEKGERFRSKAEYIIASVLNELGLYYRYECEYSVRGRTYYPDFTVIHPESGELYYIEYFGMMSDIDYSESAFKKISLYQSGPDAARFIYIFEAYNSPMNVDQVRNLLRSYFL